ncbi:MAG: 2-oxoglutarate dehydrogenase complex dihydrolipoyllysine-residue succinyltransferase [Phycisphaerales bacterium]
MVEIVVPSPGESITEVTLGAWHKQDGEWVETDEILVDIESDKATLEVRAPAAGVLKVKGASGSEQPVGAAIASIDTAAARPAGAANGAAKAEAKPAAAGAKASAGAAAASAATPVAPAKSAPAAEAKASSVARKMAADKGIDLASVPGSGPAGRVMKADIERAATAPASGAAALAMPVRPVAAAGGGGGTAGAGALATRGSRGSRREKMPKIRQRIAERLVEAQHTAAMLTTFNECDMTEVMRLRAEHKESFEKRHGVGLGFMSFFVSAACSALRRFPKVNGYIVGDEIEYHDYCDVSVAVGTDRGLVVPVLRNAEVMSFARIESTIKDFAVRARDGKLGVDEMTGGTFTITNGGIYGSLMSTPILNAPQSAILGMHAIKKRPVEDPRNPGQIALRPMMYLALSYDHRIIDGAEAVSFLVHIKDCIEKPERLLLD